MANGYIYAIYFYKNALFSQNTNIVIMRQLYRNNCGNMHEIMKFALHLTATNKISLRSIVLHYLSEMWGKKGKRKKKIKRERKTSVTLISTARQIYKRPFFVCNFINTSQLRSIIVNSNQSKLDLSLTKLNKSKIGKNSSSVTDGPTDRRTDIS